MAWGSVRWRWVEQVAKSAPRRLLSDGEIDANALREERVTRDELLAAVRAGRYGGLEAIAAVVLETDGSLSVIPHAQMGSGSGAICGSAPARSSAYARA